MYGSDYGLNPVFRVTLYLRHTNLKALTLLMDKASTYSVKLSTNQKHNLMLDP